MSATKIGPIEAAGLAVFGIPEQPPSMAVLGFDPNGTGGVGTASLVVTANPGKGLPSLNIAGNAQDGSLPQWFWMRCDASNDAAHTPRIQMPSVLEILPVASSYSGLPDHSELWIGQNPDQAAFGTAARGMYFWTRPTQNAIDLQGETFNTDGTQAYDQQIRLNFLGGNVQLGPKVLVEETGSIHAQGRVRGYGWEAVDITASNVGIGVSNSGNFPIITMVKFDAPTDQKVWSVFAASDHLQFNADADTGVNFPWMEVFRTGTTITKVQLSAPLVLPDDPTAPLEAATKQYVDNIAIGGQVFPPEGIAVSTGDAWDSSIDPATIAYLSGAAFTGDVTAPNVHVSLQSDGATNGTLNFGLGYNAPAIILFDGDAATKNKYGWGLLAGEMQFFVGRAPLGHFSFNVSGQLDTAEAYQLMRLDSGGMLLTGQLHTGQGIAAYGDYPTDMNNNNISVKTWTGYPTLTFVKSSAGADAKYSDIFTEPGGIHFRFAKDDLSQYVSWLDVTRSGATPTGANFNCSITGGNITATDQLAVRSSVAPYKQTNLYAGSDGNLHINPTAGAGILFSWDSGGGGFAFGNGAGAPIATLDSNGNLTVNGAIYSNGQSTGDVLADSFRLFHNKSDGQFYIDSIGKDPSHVGSITLRVYSSDVSTLHNGLIIDANGLTTMQAQQSTAVVAMPDGTDLNNFCYTGWFAGPHLVNGPPDSPTTDSGNWTINQTFNQPVMNSGTYGIQMAFGTFNWGGHGAFYVRWCMAGGFSPWQAFTNGT